MKTAIVLSMILCMVSPLSWSAGENKKAEPVKPALVVLDIQNQFLPMMQQEGQERTLSLINEYMKYFRQQKLPVILVYHTSPGYGPKPGTEKFQFPRSIDIKPTDIKITKNYGNAFKKTNLNQILKKKGINTLFMAGLSGTGCILATYFGAVDLDYNMFLIKGTILSPRAKYSEWVQEICQSIGFGALNLIVLGAR